jgi:hypothetical protein
LLFLSRSESGTLLCGSRKKNKKNTPPPFSHHKLSTPQTTEEKHPILKKNTLHPSSEANPVTTCGGAFHDDLQHGPNSEIAPEELRVKDNLAGWETEVDIEQFNFGKIKIIWWDGKRRWTLSSSISVLI